jgi:hypothetical protein
MSLSAFLVKGNSMFQDNRWKVYRITNHTLGEIYVGIARDCYTRFSKHAGIISGGAITISHWNWLSDEILLTLILNDLILDDLLLSSRTGSNGSA